MICNLHAIWEIMAFIQKAYARKAVKFKKICKAYR